MSADQRVGDRLRATLRPPPIPWRVRRRSASARRRWSSAGRVGRRCGRRCRPRAPWPARCSTAGPSAVAGSIAADAEARQRQRMARHPQDRLRGVGEQVVEARRHRRRTPDATAGRRCPVPSAVRSSDRYSTPADPSSSGWAQSTAGCSQVRPSEAGRARRGTATRRRSDGTPSSDRGPGRGRSSPSCASHHRSCRSPRARSRRARRGPAAPRRRARSARCRRRSPWSRRRHQVPVRRDLTTRPPVPGYGTPGAT